MEQTVAPLSVGQQRFCVGRQAGAVIAVAELSRRTDQRDGGGPVNSQGVGDKVRQQTVEQRRIPQRGKHIQPCGLQFYRERQRVLRGFLPQNFADFPQLTQQVDGPRLTGAMQQCRRSRVRCLVAQAAQAEQLRLQFFQQRRQLGAFRRGSRVVQTVLQDLKGILHAVERTAEPPAQPAPQRQQCRVFLLMNHGGHLLYFISVSGCSAEPHGTGRRGGSPIRPHLISTVPSYPANLSAAL